MRETNLTKYSPVLLTHCEQNLTNEQHTFLLSMRVVFITNLPDVFVFSQDSEISEAEVRMICDRQSAHYQLSILKKDLLMLMTMTIG